MFTHMLFVLVFVGVVFTKENDDLANLKKDHEILKKIVLELTTSNANLQNKFMTIETDLKEWKEIARKLKTDKENLSKRITTMDQDLNAKVNILTSRVLKLENENTFLKSHCGLGTVARSNKTLTTNETANVVVSEKNSNENRTQSIAKKLGKGKF